MRKYLLPIVSFLGAAVACAALILATPAPAGETVMFSGCTVGQGPDEWLPGLATSVLPTTGAAGTPRQMAGAKSIALKLPSAAAGDCYATFDSATLTSTGARGFPILRGDPWTSIDLKGASSALRVVCTAQLVTPNGLKLFLCR
jgi:hypothetical protein